MVTNNVFRSTRLFGKEPSNMVFVFFSTYDIEDLYDKSHHNGGKLEQTLIHPKP